MSFWEKASGFADAAQCKIGLHKGEWKYLAPGKCEQQRICERKNCGAVSTRLQHRAWTSWKHVAEDTCEQHRHCVRCHATEVRTEHERWSEWQYIRPDDCTQAGTCLRCGAEQHRTHHKYGDAKTYTGKVKCQLYTKCERCNVMEIVPGKFHHSWAPHPLHRDKKVCLVCSSVEETV